MKNLRELYIYDTHITELPKALLSLDRIEKTHAHEFLKRDDKVYQELKQKRDKLDVN